MKPNSLYSWPPKGFVLQEHERVALNFGEGLISLAAQREEPLNVANAVEHPNFKLVESVGERSLSRHVVAPIIHQRKVLGVLAAQQKKSPRLFPVKKKPFF